MIHTDYALAAAIYHPGRAYRATVRKEGERWVARYVDTGRIAARGDTEEAVLDALEDAGIAIQAEP